MNAAELQTIATQLAALRGQAAPSNPRHEAGALRTSDRAPSPNQNGAPKRFAAPADCPAHNLQPWGVRPRLTSVRRPSAETLAALGHSPIAWGGAFCLVGFALFRAAAHVGMIGGPVIVHLVWPV